MEQDKLNIHSAFLQQIYQYWLSQRHGRRMPRRADIDPQALMLALPHLFLVEVEHKGSELGFVFRVAGTFFEAAFDQRLTRKHLQEMKLADHLDEIMAQYRRAANERRAVVSNHKFVNEDHRQFDYERLLLPLSVKDDDRCDMILGAICFDAPLPTPSLPFLSPEGRSQ
jgi:hypothetical protein